MALDISINIEPGISVIICCYNSSERIVQTLSHLAVQLPPLIPVEIILVDNASSDNTAELGVSTWANFGSPFPLVMIDEQKKGQAYARATGVKASKFQYILFCDDDNWLNPQYLKIACELFDKNPQIGILGGIGEAISDALLPLDFKKFASVYAVGKQAPASGITTKKGRLYGAGMAGRKEILLKVFDPCIPFISAGRQGSSLSSGDDEEICCRAILLGFELYYDERLSFQHFIPAARLNEEYRKKLFAGFVPAFRIFRKYQLLIQLNSMGPLNRFYYKCFCYLKLIKDIIFKDIKQLTWTKASLFYLSSGKVFYDDECNVILTFQKNNVTL